MLPISLDSVQEARRAIAPYVRKTPLIRLESVSVPAGKEIWAKAENLQRTGSFKIRGATYCILSHLAQAKRAGVVAASAGNHAQGVAAISSLLGVKATIVMPVTTPAVKVENTRRWGADVRLFGRIYDESFEYARKLSSEKGLLFVHPFKDPHIVAGQGTLALELLEEEAFGEVEALVIAVGGGGLLSGCAIVLKELKPGLKIYAVGARSAPAAWRSFKEKAVVEEPVQYTLAEGVAVKRPDEEMMAFLRKHVTDYFSIGEESIAHAVAVAAEEGKLVVEGAGALSLAAVLEGLVPEKKIAVVLSGGNIDLSALSRVLQRGLVEQGRLARIVVKVPDRPGVLHSITQVLAEAGANIVQVIHTRGTLEMGVGETEIDFDIETRGHDHTREILEALGRAHFSVRRVF